MKKKIFIILLALAMSLTFVACSTNKILPPSAEEPSNSYDWRDVAGDDDMKVDGKFNEENYNSITPFVYVDEQTGYGMNTTVYLGAKGLYVKLEVKDNNIYYNPAQKLYENSSAILYIAPFKGLSTSLSKNTVQARVAVNEITEQWMGLNSMDGYPYARCYFDMMARVDIIKDGASVNFEKGGQVNQESVDGYNMEIYVPYKSLGLSEKPEKILLSPEINTKLSFSGGRTLLSPKSTSYDKPASYQLFSSSGYVGDSVLVPLDKTKTIDGDLSDWTTAEKTNKVSVVGAGEGQQNQGFTTYAKFIKGDGIYIAGEAKHAKNPKGANDWWMNTNFEFFMGGDNQFWINGVDKKGTILGKLITTGEEGNYSTSYEIYMPEEAIPNQGGRNYARLGFAFKVADNAIDLGGASSDWWRPELRDPGKLSSQYFIYDTGIFANPKAGDVAKTIDADLSDWTEAEMANFGGVSGRDEHSNRGYKTYAKYVQGDGLYIAGEAKHATNPTTGDWHRRTNFEMFVNGGNQRWINAFDNGNNLNLAKFVVSGTDGDYTTKYEIYIADEHLPNFDSSKDYIRLGIAFKPAGERIKLQGGENREDDWWFEFGHAPNNVEQQYYVYADGVFKTAK